MSAHERTMEGTNYRNKNGVQIGILNEMLLLRVRQEVTLMKSIFFKRAQLNHFV